MIKRITALALLVLLIAASLWYYRPWSDYSPVKLASLQDPDKLANTMRNMKTFMPFRIVEKGGQAQFFNKKISLLKFEYNFDGENKSLADFIVQSKTTGLLVIKDSTLIYENYFQGADERSLFTSWSMAKSFVATTIAIAHREGKIKSLEDTVETYASQFRHTDFGSTRIIDLLTMSSGINFDENYADKSSDINTFFFKSLILSANPDEILKPFKRNRTAENDFHYISPNSHVLSSVLRAVYNKPLASIISEKIWQPLGMEFDAAWSQHKEGNEGLGLGYCCINATLRDYARFGQFYIDSYNGGGKGVALLPTGWVHQLSKPATPDHHSKPGRYQGRGYSYHFWLPPEQDEGVFFAAGIYGQYIWMDPKRKLLIVRTSADADWTARATESMTLFKAITAHYTEQTEPQR